LASTATNGSLTIGGTLTKTGAGLLGFRANGGTSRLAMTVGTLDFTAASAGVVTFGGTGQSLSSLFITNANVSSTGTANQLVFLDAPGASNYTIGTLTLGSGGVLVMANGAAVGNQYFLNVGSLNGSAGTVRAGNESFSATTTVTLNLIGTGNGSYAGVIENGGAVTAVSKSGSGTQTLSGANSYTGGTRIAGGTLQIGGGGTTGSIGTTSGIAISNNATLAFNRTDSYGGNFTRLISGAGGVTVLAGTLALQNTSNSFTGGVTVNGGTFQTVGNSAGSNIVVNSGGTLAMAGTDTWGNATIANSPAVTINSGGTMTSAGYFNAVRNLTLNGGSVTLNGGLNTAGAFALGGTVTAGGALTSTITATTGSNNFIRLGREGVVGEVTTFNVSNAAGLLTVGVMLTNNFGASTAGLTKSGSGALTLSAANGYSAGTTLAAGTLRAGNNAAFGTGTLTLNGGTLASDSATARTITNAVTLGGDVTLTEAATGTGELTLSGPVAFGNATRTLTVAGANTARFSGALSGVNGLTKAGSGLLDLVGSNSYTIGTLAVQAGTMTVGNAAFGRFSSLGVTTADLSGTLALTGTNGGTASIGTLNMNSGSAALVLLNGGSAGETFTVNVGALNGSTGAIRAKNEVGSVVTTLAVTGNVTSSYGGSLQDGGGNTMHLLKSGTGTLTLSGANSYSGGTTLSNGVLRLEQANAAGTGLITQSSGASTLQINTTGTVANAMSIYNIQTLQTVTLSGNKTLNNATYNVTNGTTTTDSGVLSGGGGITKLGTGTLLVTASNTFTGTVDVQAGLLSLASPTGSAAGGTTNVIVATNATLLIAQSGQVSGTARVTLSGGTIQRAGGVSEVFGNLNLTTSSSLDFSGGAGGTLTFSGLDYTPSALRTLSLVNFTQGNSLVILNTSDWGNPSLPGSGFSFSGSGGFGGYSFSGSTFTITAIPEPSTYVAAAGLLGLLVFSMRRRAAPGRQGFTVDSALYAKRYCAMFLLTDVKLTVGKSSKQGSFLD
jgi:autotransporter-associated beta strand protein